MPQLSIRIDFDDEGRLGPGKANAPASVVGLRKGKLACTS